MKKNALLLALSCLFLTTSSYSQLNRKTIHLSKGNINTDTNIIKVAERVGDNLGKWSPVYDWPVAAVHMSVLPNGKVLVWDDTEDDGVGIFSTPGPFHTSVWDPITNVHNTVPIAQRNPSNIDMFCAPHVKFPNGDLMIPTGPVPEHSVYSQVYNWRTDKFYRIPNLNYGRYYPSVTVLADGNILVLGGQYSYEYAVPVVPIDTSRDKAELFANGRWTVLSNTQMNYGADQRGLINNTSYYPWIQQAPNGQVFFAGPETKLRYISTVNNGSVTDVGSRDNLFRDYGNYAMYDIGKILVAGGGNSLSSATKIDITGGVPVSTSAGNMNFGRRQGNLTIMADGNMLMTGGNSGGNVIGNQFDLPSSVYAAEVWNPLTNNWITLASMQKSRQYHSTAVLVPDGRIILGGGICNGCLFYGQNNINAEYFSPPYLFKPDGTNAPRPVIDTNSEYLTYDTNFNMSVTMPSATSIRKVHLIKLGSVTHATNFDQRLVPLTFTGTPQNLSVKAPKDGNIAPPGFYMLIVVSSAGAPSVAKIVQVGNGGDYLIPGYSPDGSPNKATIVQENTSALIFWEYPSDQKLKHFEIEKMQEDGTFKTIHIENPLKGENKSVSEYQFRDNQTNEGLNTYRIKIISDSEEGLTYFKKLSVKFESESGFKISPNPAKNYFDINLSSCKGKKVTISVIDIAGQIKFKEKIEASPLLNRIELKDFEVGQYFVHIDTETVGNKPVVKKITVVR
jgi:hypothetical protein